VARCCYIGLGSSLYKDTFCQAAKHLDESMSRAGAHRVIATGFGDEEARGGWKSAFNEWMSHLQQWTRQGMQGGSLVGDGSIISSFSGTISSRYCRLQGQ